MFDPPSRRFFEFPFRLKDPSVKRITLKLGQFPRNEKYIFFIPTFFDNFVLPGRYLVGYGEIGEKFCGSARCEVS